MEKPTGNKVWIILSIISFIASIVLLGLGMDKMFNYDNGEFYPYEYHNAYVGGDAYNFIINGNYATGFFVLTAISTLMGVGFIAIYYLSKIANGHVQLLAANQSTINNISQNTPPD